MKREDLELCLLFITAVFTVIPGGLALYEFSKRASDRERLISLSIIAAVSFGLTVFLELRTKMGRRLIRLVIGFLRQNALLVASLGAVCVLLYLLLRQIQDIVLAAITTGLVLAIACLALGAVRFLAMTRPSFLGLAAARTDLWRYDFINHLAEADQRRHQGSDIEIHDSAICDNETMRAIFEHPPDEADKFTTLTYGVMIPSRLSLIELTAFIGIEEARPTPEGLVRSKRTLENAVQFKILIDDKEVFQKRKETSQWERFSILLHSRDDRLNVSFVTNNLGENAFNWAVWGEPQLTEVTR